jgi:hypothetical protein
MDHSSVARIFQLGEAMKAAKLEMKKCIDDCGSPSTYTTIVQAQEAYDKVTEKLREYKVAKKAYRDALLAVGVDDTEDATDGQPFMSV